MAAFIAMTSWQGVFTDDYFAQPAPDPAQFGMPAEDDGSRDDPLLSDRSWAISSYRRDVFALVAAPTSLPRLPGPTWAVDPTTQHTSRSPRLVQVRDPQRASRNFDRTKPMCGRRAGVPIVAVGAPSEWTLPAGSAVRSHLSAVRSRLTTSTTGDDACRAHWSDGELGAEHPQHPQPLLAGWFAGPVQAGTVPDSASSCSTPETLTGSQ